MGARDIASTPSTLEPRLCLHRLHAQYGLGRRGNASLLDAKSTTTLSQSKQEQRVVCESECPRPPVRDSRVALCYTTTPREKERPSGRAGEEVTARYYT